MTDTCVICEAKDHRAGSCPKRNRFKSYGAWTPSWLSRALFVEMHKQAGTDPALVLYTLKDHEHEGKPSLRALYLETADPTEYEFANKYLGGWDHWVDLQGCEWFKPHVLRWRTELELKLKSEALKRIRDEAEADGRNGFAANKFLLQNGWIDKAAEPSRRGRPTKAEVKQEAVRIASDSERITEDFERLMN